jgi:hypothetical protein
MTKRRYHSVIAPEKGVIDPWYIEYWETEDCYQWASHSRPNFFLFRWDGPDFDDELDVRTFEMFGRKKLIYKGIKE